MSILVLYHDNCADGFAAAWTVYRTLGHDSAEYRAVNYGQEPPADANGRDVVIVDFSYPLQKLEDLAVQANSVLVLDHHKTAEYDLRGIFRAPPWAVWKREIKKHLSLSQKMVVLFDMERSGAGLAWDYFHTGERRPRIIDLVEDRDLWRFKHDPETRQFHAMAMSHDFSFLSWNTWADLSPDWWMVIMREGAAIMRAQDRLMRGIVKGTTRTMAIGGHCVPIANVPGAFASEAGNWMLSELEPSSPFVATYYDSSDHRQFSLRSRPEGTDVGEIAKQYGGGGHKNAAGFAAALGWNGDLI